MARVRMIVPNSPIIRRGSLIGAGNKFPSIKDSNGVVQYRLSVTKQAEGQKKPSMNRFLELALKSTTSLNKTPTRIKGINPPTK